MHDAVDAPLQAKPNLNVSARGRRERSLKGDGETGAFLQPAFFLSAFGSFRRVLSWGPTRHRFTCCTQKGDGKARVQHPSRISRAFIRAPPL